jgi:hypothetical protein
LLREQETEAAVEDADIKALELQAQKEMLQQVWNSTQTVSRKKIFVRNRLHSKTL